MFRVWKSTVLFKLSAFFEDLMEQLAGIVKNADRHGEPALFLIMTDSCLKIM